MKKKVLTLVIDTDSKMLVIGYRCHKMAAKLSFLEVEATA